MVRVSQLFLQLVVAVLGCFHSVLHCFYLAQPILKRKIPSNNKSLKMNTPEIRPSKTAF